jgi:hypothetical protein
MDVITRRVRAALLQIVVSNDCPTCEESRIVALEMGERFPALQVDLIDLDGGHPVPDGVVATPTYLLDGTVVSLDNPRPEDLIRTITELQALQIYR